MADTFPNIDPSGGVSGQQSGQEELWHREMRRRSNDIIRVKNPTSNDFFVDWDHFIHKIPANSTADVPRYIATKYCRDMKDHLINMENETKHKAIMDDRKLKGFPDYKSKWEENQETYMGPEYTRTNDYKVSTKIYDELWIGVVYEFGKDVVTSNSQIDSDVTQNEMEILKKMDAKRVTVASPSVRTESVTEPITSDEVTNDNQG